MFTDMTKKRALAGGLLAACSARAAAFAQQNAKIPDFSGNGTGWDSKGGMTPVREARAPLRRSKVKYVPNNVGEQRHALRNVNNPNLPISEEGIARSQALHDKGFAMYNRTSRCWMPAFRAST